MRVIWTDTARYQSFRSRDIITVVSSNLSDQAIGRTVGGCLTIVADPDGFFCDLELRTDPSAESADETTPAGVLQREKLRGEIATEVKESDQVSWFIDDHRRILYLALGPRPSQRLVDVGDTGISVGLNAVGELGSLIVQGVMNDESGNKESDWLDELERPSQG